MIHVNVFRDNEGICEVNVIGHSGYNDIGKDIVCAAVSTLMTHTENLLASFNCAYECISNETTPLISLIIKNHDNASNILMNVLVKDLNDVSQGYKQFIKIKENRR